MTELRDTSSGLPPTSRKLKIALAISVALNLIVAGLVGGAWLADSPHKGMPRDMSFGPFNEALSWKDRQALRAALSERSGEFRKARDAARAEFDTLILLLRADPFDAAALKVALAAIQSRSAERLDLGRSLIESRLLEMSVADRLSFADRLEKGLRKNPKKGERKED